MFDIATPSAEDVESDLEIQDAEESFGGNYIVFKALAAEELTGR